MLGPSGCGKTSTLRLIAGFERPDGGQILIDGKDMASTPPHLRPVNTVFQSYALFPHLSVGDNVAFGLKYHDLSKEETEPAGRAGAGTGQVGWLREAQAQPSCRADSSNEWRWRDRSF